MHDFECITQALVFRGAGVRIGAEVAAWRSSFCAGYLYEAGLLVLAEMVGLRTRAKEIGVCAPRIDG